MVSTSAPHTIDCPACGEPITITTRPRLTSARTPDNQHVVVFLEVDRDRLDRHLATHLTEEEAAA